MPVVRQPDPIIRHLTTRRHLITEPVPYNWYFVIIRSHCGPHVGWILTVISPIDQFNLISLPVENHHVIERFTRWLDEFRQVKTWSISHVLWPISTCIQQACLTFRMGEFPLNCGWIWFTADSPALMINFLGYSHCIIWGAFWIINGWKFNNKVYLEVYNELLILKLALPIPHLCVSTEFPGHCHIVEQRLNCRMLCKRWGH